MSKKKTPIGWVTDESMYRLLRGGNDSRGTVPLHEKPSSVAKIPLYLGVPNSLDLKRLAND